MSWGISFFLLVVTAGAFWVAQREPDAGISPPVRQSVAAQLAVMPLQVLAGSEAKDSSYIGIGIADAITTRLANIRQIGLRPTSAVLPYKNAQSEPAHVLCSGCSTFGSSQSAC